MRYLSVCSGIEAASVAFEPLGWKPLAFSEIEAFPRAVLQHHYPDTPCHGDFTVLKDEPWIVDADMLCGGTPCQAFSVAGNRQSLADDRGNLTLQFVLLADAIDHLRSTAGKQPAWILWENVPGVLSTKDNAFGSFLGGLCGRDAAIPEPEDGWPSAGVVDGPTRCAAWRILDAQHFGLAQRRKRVFVLALGGAGRWAAADALLPIIESSGWHPAPSRGKGEGVAQDACSGAGSDCIEGVDYENNGVEVGEPMGPLMKGSPTGGGRPLPVVAFDPSQVTSVANRSNPQPGDPCHTLHQSDPPLLVRMREGKEGGGKGPLVSEDQSLTLATGNDQVLAVRTANTNANGHGVAVDITHTLDQAQGQAVLAYTIHGTDKTARVASETDLAGCIRTKAPGSIENSSTTVVAFHENQRAELTTNETAGTLKNGGGKPGQGYPAIQAGMQVRRLTPVECCRLQGFPDQYLDITYRGKPAADGPKYKALGNSWAVPVVRYIGKRIKSVTP